jgi:hypothetical protein
MDHAAGISADACYPRHINAESPLSSSSRSPGRATRTDAGAHRSWTRRRRSACFMCWRSAQMIFSLALRHTYVGCHHLAVERSHRGMRTVTRELASHASKIRGASGRHVGSAILRPRCPTHRHAPLTRFNSLKLPSATRRGTSCHSRMTRRFPSGCSIQFARVIGTPE